MPIVGQSSFGLMLNRLINTNASGFVAWFDVKYSPGGLVSDKDLRHDTAFRLGEPEPENRGRQQNYPRAGEGRSDESLDHERDKAGARRRSVE